MRRTETESRPTGSSDNGTFSTARTNRRRDIGGHALTDLLLPLAIVLIAAEAGAAVAHTLRLPRVIGQIAAGLILGPSLIGVVGDGPEIGMLASVGALAILATAGLETNLSAMRRVGPAALLAAIGGVILPMILGVGVALGFGLDARASVFCGAILTATSVGITAATLQALGLCATRAGMTILAAAVIDDVLGLIVLALVVAQTSAGSSPIGIVVPMVATIVVATIGLRVLPAHLHRIADHLHLRGGGLAAMLGFVLLVAWGFERLGGLAGITGAYVAGLALAGSPIAERLKDGLLRAGEALCVPIFFASIGLAADLRTIPPVLPFALALLAVAIIGKLVGSGIGARVGGLEGSESVLVGIGMIGRGEVALVAATLGLRSGAIDDGVYAAVVLIALATTLIAPLGISLWQRGVRVPHPSMSLPSGLPVRMAAIQVQADDR
jgi:Kef-type K+ transport system membrane component KefB